MSKNNKSGTWEWGIPVKMTSSFSRIKARHPEWVSSLAKVRTGVWERSLVVVYTQEAGAIPNTRAHTQSFTGEKCVLIHHCWTIPTSSSHWTKRTSRSPAPPPWLQGFAPPPLRDGHLGQSGVGYFLLGQHCWATLVAPLLLVSAIISTSQELLHLALTLPLWAHTQKVKSAPWNIWKQLCLALVFSSSKRDTGVIYQGTWRDMEKVKGWVEPFSYVTAITQLAGPSPSQSIQVRQAI